VRELSEHDVALQWVAGHIYSVSRLQAGQAKSAKTIISSKYNNCHDIDFV
jgi:hypothetical protein